VAKSGDENGGAKKRLYLSQSDVPQSSLSDARRVAQALADEFGKQPTKPLQVAKAMDLAPGGGQFKRLTGASVGYGITDGAANAPKIALTDLGRRIVAPTAEGDDAAALRTAFLTPRVIREFLKKYNESKFPSTHIAKNVLETLGVPEDRTEAVLTLIRDGGRSLGLLQEVAGKEYVDLSGSVPPPPAEEEGADEEPDESDDETPEVSPPDLESPQHEQTRPNAIFVGHGQNKKPREQLTKLLDQYKIPYKVAEEEPNKGRPIPIKVKETMRECGAAILIFSADEELRDDDGKTVWRPSENVVHELGASSVLYDDRIIIFREEDVSLATNYESIGYITFEKDDLTAKFNELLRELIALGILKVSVND
jgi:hypothetical protein